MPRGIPNHPKKRRSRGTKAGARATANRIVPTLPVVHTVGVKFTETDRHNRAPHELVTYHYLTDLDLHPGDWAVVRGADNKLCVVAVVSRYDGCTPQASKWIIDRIDTAAAQARQDRAQRVLEAKALLTRAQEAMSQQMLLELVLPTLSPEDQTFVTEALGLPPPTRRRGSQARRTRTP